MSKCDERSTKPAVQFLTGDRVLYVSRRRAAGQAGFWFSHLGHVADVGNECLTFADGSLYRAADCILIDRPEPGEVVVVLDAEDAKQVLTILRRVRKAEIDYVCASRVADVFGTALFDRISAAQKNGGAA